MWSGAPCPPDPSLCPTRGCPALRADPPQPSHQVQRPEEEVHELSRAGVLDVPLQLGLVGSGQRVRGEWGAPDPPIPCQHRGAGGRAGRWLTSRLMASLIFWKQSTNSASEGGRARSVRTPSGMGVV